MNDQIAQAEKDFTTSNVYLTELIVNKGGGQYPAVGHFLQKTKFYYTFGDREKNPYPDRLLKIAVSIERAARVEYAEYLFDPSGQLRFAFEKNDDGDSRYYFSAGKLIRIQKGDSIVAHPGKMEETAVANMVSTKESLVAIFRRSIQ